LIAVFQESLFLGRVFKRRPFFQRWFLVLIWMVVIFSASNDRASFQHSSRFLEPVIRWLFPHMPNPQVQDWVFFFRKCAHFTEYAILAMLVWRAFSAAQGPDAAGARAWRWRPALLALTLVVAYAITDEIHQAFVPSRQASAVDVLIDSAGAAFGLAAIRFLKLRGASPNPEATS
jgi:VanZ family protein